jgi:hypothetical protein
MSNIVEHKERGDPNCNFQMGSKQSIPSRIDHPIRNVETSKVEASSQESRDDQKPQENTKQKSPPSNLKGFQLIEYKCRKKKRAYNLCYQQKHSAFVVMGKENKKEAYNEELDCEELFEIYKECIYKGMLKDRRMRGVKEPTEQSALGDYKLYADDEDS